MRDFVDQSRLSSHASSVTHHRSRFIRSACVGLALCVPLACAAGEIQSGGPYVPTPPAVVDAMLELAKVGPRDFVMDLGSGDGRIVLAAAQKYKARGMGVDIEAELVDQANASAERLGVANRVRFRQQDVFAADVSRASVLALYLLPSMMQSLRPKLLKELQPGTRIVSHDFDFGDWKPDQKIEVQTPEKYDSSGAWVSTVYLWIVPAAVGGAWSGGEGAFRLDIKQRYQSFEGTLTRNGQKSRLRGGRIEGARIRFTAPREDGAGRDIYTGTVNGARIAGEVRGDGGAVLSRWSATLIQ